ncbi:nuclear transport factor 2 family protein [Pricia sp. S334]|uniref:Nuclear transport factor 2 family protein n=1 Tax=Pricia mediterranea TaxID=3076079 RepID=A0ABU3L156_9FLAO|nr:nuclear transport factor 2 family protein [Pricia sp. S334]MDT7827328.1 nuclear transport factor 2 family protein [Pricia sp. S334]
MKTIIKDMYNAFAEGNIPAVLAGMDDYIVWNEAEGNSLADGNPYKGPDAVMNGVFGRLGAEWENFRLVDIKLHGMSNDQVLATLRYHGKYIKTGKSINAQAAHHWTLKDGKVIGFQQYVDTKQLAEAENK